MCPLIGGFSYIASGSASWRENSISLACPHLSRLRFLLPVPPRQSMEGLLPYLSKNLISTEGLFSRILCSPGCGVSSNVYPISHHLLIFQVLSDPWRRVSLQCIYPAHRGQTDTHALCDHLYISSYWLIQKRCLQGDPISPFFSAVRRSSARVQGATLARTRPLASLLSVYFRVHITLKFGWVGCVYAVVPLRTRERVNQMGITTDKRFQFNPGVTRTVGGLVTLVTCAGVRCGRQSRSSDGLDRN